MVSSLIIKCCMCNNQHLQHGQHDVNCNTHALTHSALLAHLQTPRLITYLHSKVLKQYNYSSTYYVNDTNSLETKTTFRKANYNQCIRDKLCVWAFNTHQHQRCPKPVALLFTIIWRLALLLSAIIADSEGFISIIK